MKQMHIHTPQERLAARRQGTLMAQNTFVQLLCAASILRTALTVIVPAAGCSAWWVTACCLLPGIAVYALLRLCMFLTGTDTLADCLRRCLGGPGAWVLSILLALLLLLDGTASITALITLFTEGIGTRGTQITLALLTSAVLLCSLHREGLPRAAFLLRRVMTAGALLSAVLMLPQVRADSLFPLRGDGADALRTALLAGAGMAWPFTLLLTIPSAGSPQRCRPVAKVAAACVAVLLFVTLVTPHALLLRQPGLAGSLLTPMMYAPPALRTLCLCLLMLLLFLATAGAAQLATDHLCAPMGQPPAWLPYAVLLLLTATQALDIRRLWSFLTALSPWLLLPLAALSALCFPIACFRRKKP